MFALTPAPLSASLYLSHSNSPTSLPQHHYRYSLFINKRIATSLSSIHHLSGPQTIPNHQSPAHDDDDDGDSKAQHSPNKTQQYARAPQEKTLTTTRNFAGAWWRQSWETRRPKLLLATCTEMVKESSGLSSCYELVPQFSRAEGSSRAAQGWLSLQKKVSGSPRTIRPR